MEKKILVSVSCYGNENEIVEFAKQLSTQNCVKNIEMLITCNKCEDINTLKSRLSECKLNVFVYNPGENIGYIHGGLYGIKQYLLASSGNEYDWAVICNTDITIQKNDFFDKIAEDIYDKDIWCIAPNVMKKSSGAKQNPFALNRISKHKMYFYTRINSNIITFMLYQLLASIKLKIVNKEASEIKSQIVYASHGSFFIMRKQLIDLLLNENAPLFMYGEELLIAEIIYENRKNVYYDSSLTIIHDENKTTSLIGNGKKQKWYKQSFDYLYKRFY